jgi:hypothetical protein
MALHSPGWDNSTHISVLNDGLKTIHAEDPFEDHIKPPIKPRETGSEAVEVKDEQAFLKEQQALLGKSSASEGGPRIPTIRPTNETAAASGTSSAAPAVGAAGAARAARPASTAGLPSAAPTSAAPAAAAGAAGGDGKNTDVLANFFTSLLQKKPAGAGKERKDAAAELEK